MLVALAPALRELGEQLEQAEAGAGATIVRAANILAVAGKDLGGVARAIEAAATAVTKAESEEE
jgi:hypothetical protein